MNRIARYYESGNWGENQDDNLSGSLPENGEEFEEIEVPLPAWASVAIDMIRSKRFLEHADKWRASIESIMALRLNNQKALEEKKFEHEKEQAAKWRELVVSVTKWKYIMASVFVAVLGLLMSQHAVPVEAAMPLLGVVAASLFVQPKKD